MESLGLYIQNEIKKLRFAGGAFFFIGVAIIPSVVIAVFILPMSYDEFLIRIQSTNNDQDPYHYVLKWYRIIFNPIIIPALFGFFFWYNQIEIKCGGWKYLMTWPLQTHIHFLAKFLTALLFILIFFAICAVSLIVTFQIFLLAKPDWAFNEFAGYSFAEVVMRFALLFVLLIPAMLIAYFTTLYFSHIVPILVAVFVLRFVPIPGNPFAFDLGVLSVGKEWMKLPIWTLISYPVVGFGTISYFVRQKRFTLL
jgi:hypothetical protein